MRTTRRTASIVLALAGAFFVVLGTFMLYARVAIFDSDAFADRAAETLAEERVQHALTVPLVNAIVDSGPAELINAQPILEAAVGGVIDSSAFRNTFRDAARSAHAAVFEGDAEALALNLADAGVIAIEAVRSISPEIAEDIPEDLEPELIEITDDDAALGLADLAHDVREAAIVWPLIGFLLLAGSVALAPVRRSGVIWASAAVAVGSGIMLVLYLVGHALLLAQFDDDVVRDAAAAGWDDFLGDLFTWYVALGAGGVIVAAAAYAGVREVDPAAPLRRVATVASWRPARPSIRLARGVAILGVSLFLVLRPETGLHIIVVAIGGWGLFVAVTELLLVIAPPPEPVTTGARERATGFVRRLRPQRAIAALAALAAIVVGIVLVTGGGEEEVTRPAGEVSACNGYEELCDRTLDQVALAATHNSMSAAREHGWYLPNQRYGIPRQLEDGIRVLLLDTRYGIETEGGTVVTDLTREEESEKVLEQTVGEEGVARVGRLRERLAGETDPEDARPYLCHVACELGATSLTGALTGVREFLDTHPDEFVIMFLEDPSVTPQDAAPAFEDSGILRYAYIHRRGAPFPTLRELIEADERVLILGETKSGGSELPWYQDGFELVQETPYTFTEEVEIAKPASCRLNRGTDHSPLFQVNNWVERFPRSPARAGRVNDFDALLRRARMCERRRALLPTWIAVDHYDQGDVLGVVNVLNGLDRDAQPTVRTTG